MRSKGNLKLLPALLIVFFLASCGGGGSITPDLTGGTETNPPASNPDTSSPDLTEWANQQEFEPAPIVARGIPSIPLDDGKGSSDFTDGDYMVLGKDAMDYSQCEIDGDAMIINPGGIAADNTGDIPAWALYKIAGLGDVDPLSLNGEVTPGGYGQGYSVAVADYTTMDWAWLGPIGFPEYQFDLASGHQYVTNLGNLYFLIVCGGENIATHYRSTVVLDTGGGGGNLPGAPPRLVASKGEFEDGVALTWTAGAGAEYYEVWRKYDWYFIDDPGFLPPPGDPGNGGDGGPGIEPWLGPDPDGAEWEHIADVEDLTYFDEDVVPGMIYLYKARSANEVGVSEFSNIDEGWAMWEEIPLPPPPFIGLHGYVYGDDQTDPWFDPDLPDGDPGDPDRWWPLPLEDALVRLLDPETEDIAYEEVTNEEGFYHFADAAAGEYLLTAEMEGWQFETFRVEIIEGEYGPQIDLWGWPDDWPNPWDPIAGIHGTVWGDYFLDGQPQGWGDEGGVRVMPLPDVLIKATDIVSGELVQELYTDENGFYQILELAPGAYEITAEKEDWYFEPLAHFVTFEDEVPSICLDFFGTTGGPVPPDPDPETNGICGYVYADEDPFLDGDPEIDPPFGPRPLAGVTVTLLGVDIYFGMSCETDADGYFEFADVPGAEYILSAEMEGWIFHPEEHHVIIPYENEGGGIWVYLDFWGEPIDKTQP